MSTALVSLDAIPAFLASQRSALVLISDPAEALDVERRLAAIAELTKRAGLSIPIQNEATLLYATARARLADLIDAGQSNGEIAKKGRPRKSSESEHLPIAAPRLNEGRAISESGVLDEIEAEIAHSPEKPVSMDSIVKRAKRRRRETASRAATAGREQTARDEIAAAPEQPYEILTADLREWRPAGVASIITDPPYVGDSIPLYEALRDFAVDVLPDGGPLVVMTWQAILPAVIRALDHPDLAYRWCICWRYANVENTADQKRRVFDCWKPVLVYHKGGMPTAAPMFRDEIANAAGDKDFHEWGQSVSGFERLVASFSQPGDIVCDPFLGGGTTAVAALAQTRRFIGADIDGAAVRVTSDRLSLEAAA